MELRINELISDGNYDDVSIVTMDFASLKRIEELTLGKINACKERTVVSRRRPISFGILVAIISLLAMTATAIALSHSGSENSYKYNIVDDQAYLVKENPNWGIQLIADNVSSNGLKLICNRSGGENDARLITTDFQYLAVKTPSGWVQVLPKIGPIEWKCKIIELPENSTQTWLVDWTELYGELSPGTYRLYITVNEVQNKGFAYSWNYWVDFSLEGGD